MGRESNSESPTMAKPEAWRLVAGHYPFTTSLNTRFQDLDTMGHINNVAMAGLFETARVHFHRHIGLHPHVQGVRWLVAAVSLNYVQEAHFPEDLLIGCGIGHVGNTSWTISSAAFQHGECVATCDTVLVTNGPEGRRRIDDDVREVMQAQFVSQG